MLTDNIRIDGIISVERDTVFDDVAYYRSAGIRLTYESVAQSIPGLKEGILLEVGFDTVTPNEKCSISSWAYDRAGQAGVTWLIDNRANDIACYHSGYTFVEKLQTIATKFRLEQEGGKEHVNFMRQYYDVYRLLENDQVQSFIGTAAYTKHKQNRFPKKDLEIPVAENEAFKLTSQEQRANFRKRYIDTAALYYNGQPDFDALLNRLKDFLDRL